jgi:gentisate 1,2-dioxygenase
MSPGDFVITANWAPHDHGNPSDTPMLWLDVLDAPTINFYETSFGEDFGSPTQATTRRDGDSLSFYGSGVLPDGTAPTKRTPIINYTYARTRPIVERMMAAGEIDKSHGARVRYANPSTGGPVLPTMGANLAMLPKGFRGEPYRSTDSTVFVCVEGRGSTDVDGQVLEWGPRDVFVVPSWKRYGHAAAQQSGAVLDLRPSGAGNARHLAGGKVAPLHRRPGLDPEARLSPSLKIAGSRVRQ